MISPYGDGRLSVEPDRVERTPLRGENGVVTMGMKEYAMTGSSKVVLVPLRNVSSKESVDHSSTSDNDGHSNDVDHSNDDHSVGVDHSSDDHSVDVDHSNDDHSVNDHSNTDDHPTDDNHPNNASHPNDHDHSQDDTPLESPSNHSEKNTPSLQPETPPINPIQDQSDDPKHTLSRKRSHAPEEYRSKRVSLKSSSLYFCFPPPTLVPRESSPSFPPLPTLDSFLSPSPLA